jgi:carboxyl-terminal processing protease
MRPLPWFCSMLLACGAVVGLPAASAAGSAGDPPCAIDTAPASPPTETKLSTLRQAYACVLDVFYGRDRLDHRQLLVGALAGLTSELGRRDLDQPDATMPALSGDRTADWDAFGTLYQKIIGRLPTDPGLRQTMAAATMNGMLKAVNDNHVWWQHGTSSAQETGKDYGLGFTAYGLGLPPVGLNKVRPPIYITRVLGGSAADKRLRPGDIVESADGAPLFVDGSLSVGALNRLTSTSADPVRLTLRRPSTGRTWTTTLTPSWYEPTSANVEAERVDGDVAHLSLGSFAPGSADQALAALAGLSKDKQLRGVVLDLRGNRGGASAEVTRLLSSFVHGKVFNYNCDADDVCTPNRTDDSVPLLGLPLAVLADGTCVSACDAFSGAVKDLKVGPLIGTRTTGLVSGPAYPYRLDDNSLLRLPTHYQLNADREIINGIGVAPDHYVPTTATDLSHGRDPALAKAVTLLAK